MMLKPDTQANATAVNRHTIDVVAFRQALIDWGREHFRSFLWRQTDDPYRILMAEVMLHRTQVIQVVPVYDRFITAYPDVPALASASITDLHGILYSLGLRWRIDLIHQLGSDLINRFAGQVPQGRDELLSLPGVSDYIASAVRCFAWNLPDPIIDTNTVRIAGRLFGLKIRDSSRRNRQFRDLLILLLDPDNSRAYNYALLDLGDRICTKKREPDCAVCPLLNFCVYGAVTIESSSNIR